MPATRHHLFSMPFARVYPAYVQKAERKNRTKQEVDHIIRWLTGVVRLPPAGWTGFLVAPGHHDDVRTLVDGAHTWIEPCGS